MYIVGGGREVGGAGGIIVKMRWQGLSRDSGSRREKQDGQEKYFKGKMSRTSSLTGFKSSTINILGGASLVAQWLRICLLMQGARVRALVWEDPTCHGATRPVSHNY